ncbi:MAG: Bax inhibitor-1/YccA family protein [Gammaproteobacteria bacterium]|nr:Bax inhibitor-1/YccA family protein [Gammaproteobacteria bacterium]MYF00999.1 Bax inhibitor-1/YccA family protein [Gammaproteobacteria bacterium]MYG96544.1 Bax inhibitor-1/YccA family protein [Gammaproteobacteria bacterium]
MNRRGAGIQGAGAGIEVTRAGGRESILAVNKVLRNTYSLLALTLAFSAFTALLSTNAPPVNILMFLIGAYGLLFLTHALANSAWGLLSVFAFTGFMGYTIGPIIGFYLSTQGGTDIVATALGGTAFIFFGLSGWALTSRRDFSFLRSFIFTGFLVLIAAIVISIFWPMPALQLAMSVGFMLFSSAVILYQTSEIIHGGERNYILATITLYVAIYNLFMSLLSLLSAFTGRE